MSWQENPGALLCATGEGLGNRFVIARMAELHEAGATPAALARAVCGADWDGLLLLQGDGVCDIVNRDGSPGGTCLNGLRVLARLSGAEEGVLQMDGRAVPWRRHGDEIELTLASALLPRSNTPPQRFELLGRPARAVAFWNPHAVVAVDDPAAEDLAAFARAARTREDLFPHGVNVELVSPRVSGVVRMRVDERGVGETAACGSGAVAVFLAGMAEGASGPLEVRMNGGSLHLENTADGAIRLRGGATVERLRRDSQLA